MTPGDRSDSVATAAVAVAVAFALLLAVGTAAGAPTADDSGEVDGDEVVAGNVPSIENDTDDATGDDSVLGTGEDSENDSSLVDGSEDRDAFETQLRERLAALGGGPFEQTAEVTVISGIAGD